MVRSLLSFAAVAVLLATNAWAQQVPSAEDYITPGRDATGPQEVLPADATDAVWKLIDANKDNRGTDRELDAALKPLRRLANHPDPTLVRDAIRDRYDIDKSNLIDKEEAIQCLCEVRGLRCPTAAQARTFWQSLDTDNSNSVGPDEFRALLSPLGNVGKVLTSILNNTLAVIDRDKDGEIEETEVYYSANTILRIQLATVGKGIAQREPYDWLKYVMVVAQFDMDADNTISPQESLAISPLASNYRNIDKNNNQEVSVEELYDYREKIAKAIAAARAARLSGSC
jgi:Ca2+-binding EF-hand superfamily protein